MVSLNVLNSNRAVSAELLDLILADLCALLDFQCEILDQLEAGASLMEIQSKYEISAFKLDKMLKSIMKEWQDE